MYATREAWLQDAAGELTPVIEAGGLAVPLALRVACGFPSTFRRSGALGETFTPKDSADRTVEVLISPTVDSPHNVLLVLLRQLVEATASTRLNREAVCASIGLNPQKPNLYPTGNTSLIDRLDGIAAALGAYPHAALSLADRPKAATRLLKAVCPTCGYTIRLTAKWTAKGMPVCYDGDTFNLETTQEA